jgi:hypothetical protein
VEEERKRQRDKKNGREEGDRREEWSEGKKESPAAMLDQNSTVGIATKSE